MKSVNQHGKKAVGESMTYHKGGTALICYYSEGGREIDMFLGVAGTSISPVN